MTSLQNHPRPKWKSRSFWSCFEAPFIPLFWGVKIPYMNRMGPILVRSFWKELSTILKILKCNNLRFSFLEENLRWKLVIYCIYKLFRSKVYCWVNVSSATNTVKSSITPPHPPNSTPLLPHTQPSLSSFHIIPLPTTQLNICFGFPQPCWESTPIPRQYNLHALRTEVFRVVLGVPVCRGRTLQRNF